MCGNGNLALLYNEFLCKWGSRRRVLLLVVVLERRARAFRRPVVLGSLRRRVSQAGLILRDGGRVRGGRGWGPRGALDPAELARSPEVVV